MTHSNFSFLEEEFPILFNIGQSTEFDLYQDPITCYFKIRQFGERLTAKLFEELFLEFSVEDNSLVVAKADAIETQHYQLVFLPHKHTFKISGYYSFIRCLGNNSFYEKQFFT